MGDKAKLLIEEVLAKPGRIDKDQGILYDVLLLGPESLNGTRYPDETRAAAVPLFEGVKVNLSHPAKRDKSTLVEPTPWDRRYGRAFDAHNTPDGIRGNVKVLKSHGFTKTLMEAAEEMPEMFGFSPVMLGVCSARDANGVETCVQIKRVKSVDIVTDPGTTKSLFEDLDLEKELAEEEAPKEAPAEQPQEQEQGPHHDAALMHTILDEIEEFLDRKRDALETSSRIDKHLKHHAKMFHGEKEEEEAKESPKEEAKEKEEEEHFSLSRGTKVLTEEVKKPVEVKKVKSGVKPTEAGPNWMSILRK